MATYSSNVTIKVSNNILVSWLKQYPTDPFSGTLYTVPANSYAIISLISCSTAGSSANARLTINGVTQNNPYIQPWVLHLGPGSTIGWTQVSFASNFQGVIMGVEFVNS